MNYAHQLTRRLAILRRPTTLLGFLLSAACTSAERNLAPDQPAIPGDTLTTPPTDSFVPPPPPPPPDTTGNNPGGGGGSNEPAGYVPFAENGFSVLPGWPVAPGGRRGQWYAAQTYSAQSIGQDAAAPESPSSVLQTRFRRGMVGGLAPVYIGGWALGYQPKRAVYVSLWIKIMGPDYENHPVGTKMGFFGGGRSMATAPHNTWFFLKGKGGGRTTIGSAWNVQLHQSPGDVPYYSILEQNVDRRALMTTGAWHHWEAVLVLNTLGRQDGTFKWWIDGTKVMDYSSMVYINPGNTLGFWNWAWNPTWGGGGGYTKTRDDFILIDHIYMSGIDD